MQMNLLRKVSLLEFRAASSSDAVKPTPCARIGLGRAGAAGHRRTTRLESSARELGRTACSERVFRKVNHYVLKRMARFLNRKSQRYYRLKFADTYYGEMAHYGLYRLAWADVRRTRG